MTTLVLNAGRYYHHLPDELADRTDLYQLGIKADVQLGREAETVIRWAVARTSGHGRAQSRRQRTFSMELAEGVVRYLVGRTRKTATWSAWERL